jgi:hypothetical protein
MSRAQDDPAADWPALPFDEWRDTLATLHMWTQVVGKVRLALAPAENHWWHVAFPVTSRGLTTGATPCGARTFQVDFDFVEHVARITVSDGLEGAVALGPRSVADFHRALMAELRALGLDVAIWPKPVEVVESIPFHEDHRHDAYDRDRVDRFWQALQRADRVLKRFRGEFHGKSSPVHFFWGSFDLAVSRFSGRPAPEHPGGFPNLADWVTREAYSHEVFSAGWWPGHDAYPEPAFYAYAYPEPAGFAAAAAAPDDAFYHDDLREFVLPWEAVRRANDPDDAVLAFLRSAYAAAAELGDWPRSAPEPSTARVT